MKAIILVGGQGTRIWPYNEIRNKASLPIGNKKLIQHTVAALKTSGIDEIIITGWHHMDEIRFLFFKDKSIEILEITPTTGSAKTLLLACKKMEEDFLVLFGDCYVQPEDIQQLVNTKTNSLLVDQTDKPKNHIIVQTKNDAVLELLGHPRGLKNGYVMFGAHLNPAIIPYLENNQGRFTNTKVGVGSPNECFLEESLNQYNKEYSMQIVKSEYPCFDINKPWEILTANAYHNMKNCGKIAENTIGEGSCIDDTATIMGKVSMGKNSKIGKYVVIQGNCIIGDNTILDQGAIIGANVVIGNDCVIQNYCKIADNSTIGNLCIVEHTAELLGGMLMDKVYLYHYGEFYGICGEKSDLGAGSVCGTLRFDDGETIHQVKGRKEIPEYYSNATFVGDYVRTGVNVIFQPGVKVGANSVVGSGIVLQKDVPSGKLIYLKQEIIEKEWGSEQYGW